MSGNQVYQALGGQGIVTTLPPPVQAPRDPTSSDIVASNGSTYNLLQQWINTVSSNVWTYLGAGNWQLAEDLTGNLLTLTDTTGTIVTPSAGNIQISGTANQVSVTAGTHKLTVALPSAITTPGSLATTTTLTGGTGITATLGNIVASAGNITATLGNIAASAGSVSAATTVSAGTTVTAGTGITSTLGNIVASAGNITATLGNIAASAGSVSAGTSVTAGTTLTATLGNITATNGNIVRGTAGNKDVYSSVATTTTAGANSAGTVTLSGGTATVATTAVTAASQIRLYRQGIGSTGAAALGVLTLGTVTANTSFVINAVQPATATSLQASDVSVIGWEIVN